MTKTPPSFEFVGGHLALDFVNTVANRGDSARARELLQTQEDVAAWLDASGLGSSMGPRWRRRLGVEARTPARLRAAREHLYRLMEAAATGRATMPAPSLHAIERVLRAGRSQQRLLVERGLVVWGWREETLVGDRALHAIVSHAVELLSSAPPGNIRFCDGVGCGWLFLDRSPAGRRRWCSMRDCGNREKAKRHYHRT